MLHQRATLSSPSWWSPSQLLLLLLLLMISRCEGLPGGAPLGSCVNLTPGHFNTGAQQSPFPFQLQLSASSVLPGANIAVTISGTEQQQQFRGFLVQARPAQNPLTSPPLGEFVNANTVSQTIDCCGVTASAITHVSADDRGEVTVTWQAPTDLNTDVVFVATVVQNFSTYWVGEQSNIITLATSP